MQDQNSVLVRRILISYAVTFIVINFTDSLTMIADSMVISRALGATALAATGLADPSYKIASLFSGVLAGGLQSLCAQAMGSGDRERANRVFTTGLIMTLAAVVLLTTVGFSFMGTLCNLFGAGDDPVVYRHLYDYLQGWFFGLPGYIVFFVLSPLATLDGNKRIVTAATLAQSTVNIAGDLISVYALNAGTYGVGFATGLAYNVSAVILILSFYRKRSVFRPFGALPDFRILPQTVNIGLPKFTEQLCKIAAPLVINRTIIAIGGSIAMSAISVKSSLMGFCVIIGNGIAESVRTMAQILFNEKDADSLKKTVKVGFGLLLGLVFAFSALLFAFSGLITGLYFPKGSEEWQLASRAVRCLSLALVLNGCNSLFVRYLQAIRKMLPVHLYTTFHRMVSLSLFTMLLGHYFGVNGLFAAIPVSEAASLLGYVAVALLRNRFGGFWNSVLMIRDGLGYTDENSRSFSITTVEEAVAVSEQIEAFCEERHVDHRKSYFSARCMEELATNVIEHGFTKDNKKHSCDIRVMIDPDEVTLRVRDDCRYFNIRERYDSLTQDDADSSVGIRLVFALAKDVNYINIFNTNTLIIRM